METVSYLTINDETKEIADLNSRDNIEDIKSILAAYRVDIDNIQFETSEQGPLAVSIEDAYTTAVSAQTNAASSLEAAGMAWDKADSAANAADLAWDQASSAIQAADTAWNKAEESSLAAAAAETKANEATDSANVAYAQSVRATNFATEAQREAEKAQVAANTAQQEAATAHEAALDAKGDAVRANDFANGALTGLSTLESIIDTVNWFADHRTASADTTVNVNKNYYIFNEETGTMSKAEPDGTENPVEEGWYEVDETIQNYVVSHIATTDDGLYVLSTASGWRVLISTGNGDYVAGVFIVDPQSVIKQALTGDGISFDKTSPFYIGDDNAYILFEPPYQNSYGNDSKGHIKIVATDNGTVDISGQVSIGGTGKTLSDALEEIGQSIKKIEYGIGNSSTDHSDIQEWSEETPAWSADKYIWMRTSSIDNRYNYTCIQGVQGPQGEIGPTGPTGETGEQGVGKSSVEISYGVSDYENIEPTTWEDDMANLGQIEQGKWLWVRTVTEYTDLTSDATYQKSYIGKDGESTPVYELLCDPSAIAKSSSSDVPPEITFMAKKTEGAGMPADYPARFIISTSEDGINWTNQYTSESNEAIKKYTASADVKFVRGQLYLAGDTVTLLDTQTVPIISDGYQGEDGKSLNIHPDIYTISQLPSIEEADEGDAYLVDDDNGGYDLYYKGTGASAWTIVEDWGGIEGPPGPAGPQGPAGTDGYTIVLTNESHNFPAGTNAAITSSTTCNVIGYKGITQVPISIGTITGQVIGLTTSIIDNNSTSAGFSVNVTTELTTRDGILIIPIVIDGKSFEKRFSWTLSIQGQKGDKGDPGQDGATGPEAIVTIVPSNIDWDTGTATLTAVLRVNGIIVTPTTYNWTKGTTTTSLGTMETLDITDLNSTYNCTVTW